MNTPTFLITSYLEACNNDLEQLRKTLFAQGVLTKDYMEEGLILLYHKYETPITTDLEREVRSLVIDRETLKIKAYSCETPHENKEGLAFMLSNPSDTNIITTCYEGTFLSVFYHNTKWFVSTRRCLNSHDSVFNPLETTNHLSHFDMFIEVLKNAGYSDFDSFCDKLDKSLSYYFVLIHHQNNQIIDYSDNFGDKYSRICLTTIRDVDMRELDIYGIDKVSFASYDNSTSSFIFVPEKHETFEDFIEFNKTIKYDTIPESEGVIIRQLDPLTNKYHLIKLQTYNYQFAQALGQERNIFKGFVYLYQNDKLVDFFNQNTLNYNIKKIVNPLNPTEAYDTVGMIDAVFKVCTSELFELFKMLYSLKTGHPQNKELYDILPKEYKDIMFAIRGLYYKKKTLLHNMSKDTVTPFNIKNAHLRISDIYTYLKSLSTDTIITLLQSRRLMLNWVRLRDSQKSLLDFSIISQQCDKVHLKLCAIFTNKLYPNIMNTDIPKQSVQNLE